LIHSLKGEIKINLLILLINLCYQEYKLRYKIKSQYNKFLLQMMLIKKDQLEEELHFLQVEIIKAISLSID